MTKSKTIVLCDREDILSSSIELILSTKAEWSVISTADNEDLRALIMAAGVSQTDIVIIHQGYHDDPPNLPLQLLQAHPAIKVIMISLEDNLMDVYSKQKILLEEATDLITVIESESQHLRSD